MSKQSIRRAHQETQAAWEANAATWDALMGDEGNDFVNLLCWPAIERLLKVKPGQTVLKISLPIPISTRHCPHTSMNPTPRIGRRVILTGERTGAKTSLVR